ncbi:NmrA-domain-containing protein [Schizophyllum commune H4-8]|uniref:NmrA-like family domain-containing protein 1 n=1 Tax=Schizophyllum commune (strain H4-8 / FGSC 9210) TaxID=578458 RepID=D8PTP6_SCHCM|nr:NmrA-domain-containing protein [Schizophyllum commune H4-8]KAI5899222.1 NmrA-domain-containing protein [Schizophyllum commune H4-8]
MSKQIITVFGATGKQGGSVVDSILGDATASSKFSVRAVTRDATKPNAKALVAKGAEVVSANLDDKESLRSAIKGSYGVFAVTNFWEYIDGDREIAQGKNIADASKEEGVQHLIWSSVLNVTKLTKGVLSQVAHFDSKATVEEYIRDLGIPATFFLAGFYMSNFPGDMLSASPDRKWKLNLPMPDDAPIPLFAAEYDTGKFVKAIFLKREETLGKRVYGATAYTTPVQIIDGFNKVYGKHEVYKRLTGEEYKATLAAKGYPEALQEEMLQNMRLVYEFGYYGGDNLDWSVSLVDEPLTTWEEYIKNQPAFAAAKQ